jgi:TRAP-type C4-dicarboxylate transport system permease small subunit
MARLLNLHDTITRGGYQLATLLVVVIAASYCYEVVSRYFFNAPTEWANAVVSYFLCAVIFLVLPEQTRRHSHITITLLLEKVDPATRRIWMALLAIVSGLTCLAVFWIAGLETWTQYRDGILTVGVYEIPKWWTSIVISYGLLSAGLYFLRGLLRVDAPTAQPDMPQ